MADAFEIEAFVGVEESVDASAVSVYPNPVNGVAKVNMTLANSENVVVEIYNAVGQKVASVNYGDLAAGAHNLDVDFSSLEAGVYYVNVTTGTQVISKKVTCVK
jgi:flagellar hook assembly protein FlgD